MTPDGFRRLALELPEAVESAHMGHPDFRVGGRIFATLGCPDAGWGMVKLDPDQQEAFTRSHPAVFAPVPGGWGQRGATRVALGAARAGVVRDALFEAWRYVAPKKLLAAASRPLR